MSSAFSLIISVVCSLGCCGLWLGIIGGLIYYFMVVKKKSDESDDFSSDASVNVTEEPAAEEAAAEEAPAEEEASSPAAPSAPEPPPAAPSPAVAPAAPVTDKMFSQNDLEVHVHPSHGHNAAK